MPWGSFVRLNRQDLADQQPPRLSRGELMPFSELGSTVQFENVSAVEVGGPSLKRLSEAVERIEYKELSL